MSIKTSNTDIMKSLTLRKAKTRFCKRPPVVKAYLQKKDFLYIPLAYGLSIGYKPNNFEYEECKAKSSIKLRKEQINIYDTVIKKLKTQYTYFLNAACATGKTIMGVHSIAELGLRTIVVLPPLKNLIGQWGIVINEFMPKAKICILGMSVNKAESKYKLKNLVKTIEDADIILTLPTAVGKICKDDIKTIGYLICDEVHKLCTENIYKNILRLRPKYALALTATYEREDGMHILIDKMFGIDKYQVISQKPFLVYKVNTPYTPDIEDISDWSDIVKKLALIEDRNNTIADMILKDYKEGDKVLIMCFRTFHADNMWSILEKKFKTEKFYKNNEGYKNCQILCSTFTKGGVGFDPKNACTDGYDGVPFNKCYIISSKKKIEQIAGRVFRSNNPIIYHFVDKLSTFQKHWEICEEWYKSRNGTIKEINLINEI